MRLTLSLRPVLGLWKAKRWPRSRLFLSMVQGLSPSSRNHRQSFRSWTITVTGAYIRLCECLFCHINCDEDDDYTYRLTWAKFNRSRNRLNHNIHSHLTFDGYFDIYPERVGTSKECLNPYPRQRERCFYSKVGAVKRRCCLIWLTMRGVPIIEKYRGIYRLSVFMINTSTIYFVLCILLCD